jgi:hypothetical protein
MRDMMKQYQALREATASWAEFPRESVDKTLHAIMLAESIEEMDQLLVHYNNLKEAVQSLQDARYKLLSTALRQAEQKFKSRGAALRS